MTIISTHPPSSSEQEVDNFPYPPTDLSYDDGEPLETPRHRAAMNILIDSLYCAWADRNDYYVGGNMFLYYSATQAKNYDYRGPDFFAVLGVDRTIDRKYWAIWDEGGKYPDVIIELMSPSTAKIDVGEKKQIYERIFRTADYFVYDPYNSQSLKGWHLGQNQRYQELDTNEQGWLWCQSLELWLGTWEGTIRDNSAPDHTHWLRFYDAEKHLILLQHEAAQQRAEQAQKQAEQAQKQAEQAQQQAEQAQQRAEKLAEHLRSLGVDPSQI